MKIPLIDFIKLDDKPDLFNKYDFAFYTGINKFEVPVNSKFNCLFDNKSGNYIFGDFEIKRIEILQKPFDTTLIDYNAIIYLSSSVKLDYFKSSLDLNEKGNIKNVWILSNVYVSDI